VGVDLEEVQLRDTAGVEDGMAVLMEAERGAVRVRAFAVEGERALALADGAALLEEEAVAAEPLDEPAGGIADSVRGQGRDGEGTAQGPREMPVPSANALKWMTPLSTRVSSAGCPVQGWTPMSAVGSFTSRDRRTLGERGAR
jgi:hypothetical protein